MKCTKCQTENPKDSKYCKECATPLLSSGADFFSHTKTLHTPVQVMQRGKVLANRFEIIEELGRGGMGNVYKVEDKKINEIIAIKLIKPEIASDVKTLKRFSSELKTARKIIHKNVARVYELMEADGISFITMEFVSGQNLKSLFRQTGQLTLTKTISITRQICEGLAEAHRLGVVHRDLKPNNIMIDSDGNARIMDFGIARSERSEGLTGEGIVIGTPEYMSPEQAEAKQTDIRSDIYSLGILIYEMVTGRLPFEGDTPLSIALKHKTEEPASPKTYNPQLTDALNGLILKCLAKDKKDRYPDVESLVSELLTIERDLPGTQRELKKRKPLTSKELTVQFSLKRFYIPVIIVIVILAIVFFFWQPWTQKRLPSISPDIPSLAVMYFKNNTGDKSLDIWRDGLCFLLISDLSQSKYIRVLPRDRLYTILKKINAVDHSDYTSYELRRIAELGFVNLIILGSYYRDADSYRAEISIQDANTSEIIDSKVVKGTGKNPFAYMTDEFSLFIRNSLNLTQAQLSDDIDRSIGEITTDSPAALEKFIEAARFIQDGKEKDAIPLLLQATEEDPEFATAYYALAASYHNIGLERESMKFGLEAFGLRNKMSDRERLLIEGVFYKGTESTYEKSLEAYEKLLELYPWDAVGNHELGGFYLNIEEWDKAIERIEVVRRFKSELASSYFMLALAYNAIGKHEKAREVLEEYINDFSDAPRIRGELALTYFYLGNYRKALQEAERANATDLDPFAFHVKGILHYWKGEYVEAEEEFTKFMKIDNPRFLSLSSAHFAYLNLEQGRFETTQKTINDIILSVEEESEYFFPFHLDLAYIHLHYGNINDALENCERALKIARKSMKSEYVIQALTFKGLAQIRMKKLSEAIVIAEEMNSAIETGWNKKFRKWYFYLKGRIEFDNKNYSEAVDNFKQAVDLEPIEHRIPQFSFKSLWLDSLARAHFKYGDLEGAIRVYEQIISLKSGRLHYSDIYAKAFYNLGKMYEEKGWPGKAIESYEKFLDIWNSADPGLPEVDDAKKRVAGLKGP